MLFNYIWMMLNGDKFSNFFENRLWAEKANTGTVLENNLIRYNRELNPF